MAKFKKGDKVRIKNNSTGGHETGDCGEITRIEDDKFYVKGDMYARWEQIDLYHKETDLELVEESEPTPKFKVGDRVECKRGLNTERAGAGYSPQKQFVIKRIDLYPEERDCAFPEGGGNGVYVDCLELIKPSRPLGYFDEILVGMKPYNWEEDYMCQPSEREDIIKEPKIKTKTMSKVTTFIKNLTLSADEKLLRKYGLHDEDGNNTGEAEVAILENFYNSKENQAYILEIAKGLAKEDKESK